MSASALPITQLGATIKAHIGRAEIHAGKVDEHYIAAGLHLVEAKARIAAGEYEGKFAAFLTKECSGLSSSRAYELIAIATGTSTLEAQRERARDGMRESRAAAASRQQQQEEFMEGVRAERERMASEAIRKEQASAKGHAQASAFVRNVTENESAPANLIRQITSACRGVSTAELEYVLSYLQKASRVMDEAVSAA